MGLLGLPLRLRLAFAGFLRVQLIVSNCRLKLYRTMLPSSQDLLQRFWETEELSAGRPALSVDERSVVTHFQKTHCRDEAGRFIIPLPRTPDVKPLGESRSLSVRRFLSLERSLQSKNKFQELSDVVIVCTYSYTHCDGVLHRCAVHTQYFEMGHTEADISKPCEVVLYLPMNAVVKESSTTTKVRAIYDASAKPLTGVSLNVQLLVGPTMHSSLIDVLLCFRLH